MPATTRGQANQFREEEFAVLRKIDVEFENGTIVVTTPSATGFGTHKRWFSQEIPSFSVTQEFPQSEEKQKEEQVSLNESERGLSLTLPEPHRAPTPYWIEEGCYGYITPKSSPPPTPAAPKINRMFSTSTGPFAEEEMSLRISIKKGDNIEVAIRNSVEMYKQELAERNWENHKRVYDFISSRPPRNLAAEGTELFGRNDSSWDSDPFL